MPFYQQPTLGGPDALRGFRPFRFYDNNAVLVQGEYRWEASRSLDVALFADGGKRIKPTLIDRIPQTRAEAIHILGMGVMPDTSQAAMKKLVDGLRLSWHPDLAKDETDRHLREFRIKQINTAWDLIQGRRMERLDS